MSDREERIRARAHEIWEQAGRPLGEDLRHWEQAAREIDEEDAASAPGGGASQASGGDAEGDARVAAPKPEEDNSGGPA
jgi:hypothetical protein